MSTELKLLLATLALLLGASAMAAESTGAVTSKTFTGLDVNASVLPNPERGWAAWSGSDLVSAFDSGSLASGYATGNRLAYCTVQIGAFRGTSISSSFLANLQSRFDSIRAAGMKCVLLVAYDVYGGSGNDDTAANIVSHIGQFAPLLRGNADVIAFIKAGFIGSYGEWWGSANGNSCGYQSGTTSCATAKANRLAVRNALLAAVHPLTAVQFRYPDDHVQWAPSALSELGAFSGSSQSRQGFHNDCQLSASADSGTWNGPVSGLSTSSLQAYAAAVTNYTPYGGELSSTCAAPHKISCAEAIADWSKFHLTYLKDSNDFPDYKAQWASEGCTNKLSNLMGYRLQLDSVSHQGTATAGETISVYVNLHNVGWSRLFSPRRVVAKACLVASPYTCYSGTSPTDLRILPPQATASQDVMASISIPAGAVGGSYQIQLAIPDTWPKTATLRAFAIRPANADNGNQAWNDATGTMATGTTLTVK
jgi:hypothetical protein